MARLLLRLAAIAVLGTCSEGLTFRTTGGNQPQEDSVSSGGEGPAEAFLVDGNVVRVRKRRSAKNTVVDAFFADPNEDSSIELRDEIRKQASGLKQFIVETRRNLHQHPELMFKEELTSAYIQSVLKSLDITFTAGWGVNTRRDVIPGKGGYGIVADIGTGQQPCVLLRADIDALPIVERTEGVEDFISQNNGRMHACGHDGHTAMLLGAASMLKGMEDSIQGTVRVIFQPAEEGGAGGKRMREEGVLELDPKPQHAFGMHLWPTLPSGSIASRPGPLLAATEDFEVLVAGVGGHAAMPSLTIDPIVTLSSIVMNLQTLVSRTLNPLEAGVCSVTAVQAGEAFNIIPASALMRGTLRALSTETLMSLRDRFERIVTSGAELHGCNVTITYSADYYPPTVNDPTLFEEFSKHVGALVSAEGYLRDTEATMGGEDFSFIAEAVPSTFFLLGQGDGTEIPTDFGLHHPHFAIDENVLSLGTELHVNLALRALAKLASEE